MTTPTESSGALTAFLKENKQKFLADVKLDGAKSWTVVMGNEAGDLDSCASAIAYSYLTPLKPAIGLIQTPRADLYLRTENLSAFALAKINVDDLLCLSDISDPSQLRSSYALVDHNSLLPSFRRTDPPSPVVGIIDHHEDEGQHLDAPLRNITTPLGSCASLVAHTFKDAFANVTEEEGGVKTPASTLAPKELATLLLTAIYLDTGGMKPKGKGVPLDFAAGELLENYAGHPTSGFSGGDSFREVTAKDLSEKKHSVAHLSSRDLLRRDYKEYVFTTASGTPLTVGLSTVPLGTKAWLQKEEDSEVGYRASLENWAKERKLDVVGVLNTFKSANKGHKRRELLILVGGGNTAPISTLSTNEIANVETIADALKEGLEATSILELEKVKLKDEFEDIKGGKGHNKSVVGVVHFWRQNNTEATRKLVAPAFKSIMEGLEGVKSTFVVGENVNK